MVTYRYGNRPRHKHTHTQQKPLPQVPIKKEPEIEDKLIETRIEKGKKIEVYKFRL